MPELPSLLTTKEVADAMKVSPRAIQRWVQEAGLPATKLGGKLLRFEATEVAAWYEQQGRRQ
jgi:excisionase family DNA binding protein